MIFPPQLDREQLPKHIAIIMDGNGRWALERGLLRTLGHKVGVDSVRDIVKACRELGIQVLTLYAFSTENWSRPSREVKTLMTLLKTYLKKEFAELYANNIRVCCLGQKNRLPNEVVDVLNKVMDDTADNDGMVLNLALSYGSRNEMVHAVRNIVAKSLDGSLNPDSIDETTISDFLYTANQPDPDLLIRTGGESRLSNFLLWQLSYAELYFTPIFWPDFRQNELIESIHYFQKKQRRFGKTGEQSRGTRLDKV